MSERISSHVAVNDAGDIIHPDDDPNLDATFSEDSDERDIVAEMHTDALRQLEQIKSAPGPFVALGTRASKLIEVIEASSKANSLAGFQMHANGLRMPAGAANKEMKLRTDAKQAFREAYGYDEMIQAGDAQEDVSADFIDTYAQFRHQYLKPGDAAVKNRTSLKKRLATVLETKK